MPTFCLLQEALGMTILLREKTSFQPFESFSPVEKDGHSQGAFFTLHSGYCWWTLQPLGLLFVLYTKVALYYEMGGKRGWSFRLLLPSWCILFIWCMHSIWLFLGNWWEVWSSMSLGFWELQFLQYEEMKSNSKSGFCAPTLVVEEA